MNTIQPCEIWTNDQIKVIRSMYAKNLNDDEFLVYATVCKHVNLDPLAKQIYAIKRANNQPFRPQLMVIV